MDTQPEPLSKERVDDIERILKDGDEFNAEIKELIDGYREVVSRLKDIQELYLVSAGVKDGSFQIELQGEFLKIMAGLLYQTFLREGGDNFVSWAFTPPETDERFELTVKRATGKTPAELASEMRRVLRDSFHVIASLVGFIRWVEGDELLGQSEYHVRSGQRMLEAIGPLLEAGKEDDGS